MSGDAYHITAPAEGHDGAFRSMRAAMKNGGLHARGHPVRQRARHLDPARRRPGAGGGRAAVRRCRAAPGDVVHQVRDRPPAGRGGRGGGDLLDPGDPRRRGAADAEPGRAEPRQRDRPRRQRGAAAQDPASRCPTVSASAAPTPPSSSAPPPEAAPPVEPSPRRRCAPACRLALLVLLGALIATGGALTARHIYTMPGPLPAARDVVVPHGGVARVAQTLLDADVIASKLAFRLAMLATRARRPAARRGTRLPGARLIARGAGDPAHRAPGGAPPDHPRGPDRAADRPRCWITPRR